MAENGDGVGPPREPGGGRGLPAQPRGGGLPILAGEEAGLRAGQTPSRCPATEVLGPEVCDSLSPGRLSHRPSRWEPRGPSPARAGAGAPG